MNTNDVNGQWHGEKRQQCALIQNKVIYEKLGQT